MHEIGLVTLSKPFPARDVEWRVQSCGERNGKIWAKVLAYITNRAIMERLDTVVGPANWKNEFREWGTGAVLCGISIRCGEEWVTKWDGAENTDVEAVKGGLSSAMKRTAVQWGIGRYLYDLEEGWALIVEKGAHYAKTKEGKSFQWNPPLLPPWALPGGQVLDPNSPEANSASPAEQKDIRQANHQPTILYANEVQQGRLETLASELSLTPQQWNKALSRCGIKRKSNIKVSDIPMLALELHREAVAGMLTELGFNLDDVRMEDSSVAADTPDELTLDQANAALVVLRGCKAREAVSV